MGSFQEINDRSIRERENGRDGNEKRESVKAQDSVASLCAWAIREVAYAHRLLDNTTQSCVTHCTPSYPTFLEFWGKIVLSHKRK